MMFKTQADISELLRKAKAATPKREGPQPGIVLTQPELEEFAKMVARDCIACLDDPPTGSNEWVQMLDDVECINHRYGL